MGNTCCSNDANKELEGFSTKIELKKSISKRDAKLTSNTNMPTAPSSQQYQQSPQNI